MEYFEIKKLEKNQDPLLAKFLGGYFSLEAAKIVADKFWNKGEDCVIEQFNAQEINGVIHDKEFVRIYVRFLDGSWDK